MRTANLDLVYSLGSNRIAIGGKDFAKLSEALNVKSPGRHAGLNGRGGMAHVRHEVTRRAATRSLRRLLRS